MPVVRELLVSTYNFTYIVRHVVEKFPTVYSIVRIGQPVISANLNNITNISIYKSVTNHIEHIKGQHSYFELPQLRTLPRKLRTSLV